MQNFLDKNIWVCAISFNAVFIIIKQLSALLNCNLILNVSELHGNYIKHKTAVETLLAFNIFFCIFNKIEKDVHVEISNTYV